ncbi:MAG: amidohydrolase [Chloroflexota bacterium]
MRTEKIDQVLVGGRFYPMDQENQPFAALAIAGDRIVATGSVAEIDALAPAGCRRVDLGGRAVVPGLIDSHNHLTWYGFFLNQVDLNGVKSIAELQARISAHARSLRPGEWLTGGGWEQGAFADKRYPTRHDLDAVVSDRPVVLDRVCYHAIVVNSRALELAGITRDTPAPADGEIRRDADGEPNGILTEAACDLVKRHMPEPSADQKREALLRAMARANACGLTSVHSNDDGMLRVMQDVRNAGKSTVRIYLDRTLSLEAVEAAELITGFGDEWLRIGSVKMFVDGSLGARTAALYEPYSDEPATRGLMMYAQEDLDALVLASHRKGMQVAIHAIGDRAVDSALDAIERAVTAHPRADYRHRIIHLQVINPQIIERLRTLRLIADIQPKFVTGELAWAGDRVGQERIRWSYAWKSLLDAGVHCAGGSDCPVEPLQPLWGIYAAVTRAAMDGTPAGGWLPEQRLSVDQAVALFTRNAAYVSFEEGIKGTLTPGKLADLVVLGDDPFVVDPLRIKDIRVQMTMVGGKVVYEG